MFHGRELASLVFLGLVLTGAQPAVSATLHVPTGHPTIQGAIAAAENGDLVLVAPGTYAEELTFLGKAITVRGEAGAAATILDPSALRAARSPRFPRHLEERLSPDGRVEIVDRATGRVAVDAEGRSPDAAIAGDNEGSVVLFTDNETRQAVLEGFTITGGLAEDGGGVRIEQGASPTLRNNIIRGNRSCFSGAAISISSSSPLIENNVISDNLRQEFCGSDGGALYVLAASSAVVRGNLILNNSHGSVGGIYLFSAGTPTIAGNFIVGNSGDGLRIVNPTDALIVQNVIRGNTGDGVSWRVPQGERGPFLINNTLAGNGRYDLLADGFDAASQVVGNVIAAHQGGTAVFCGNFNDPNPPVIRANNVLAPNGTAYGGICGNPTGTNGNISADPLFADPAAGDLRLLPGSPSIDAGDSGHSSLGPLDLDGFPRIADGDGDRIAEVDQGAYEHQGNLLVFADGFESGDSAAWSGIEP